jgi:glycosyltransferase involved in cell wall biosynthesis
MDECLVSLIIPFYNAEEYMSRCLEGVLAQTYKNIQFILVDDGSTDASQKIVHEYEEKLDKRLTEFIFLKQVNGGAASAVNNALKYVKGYYLSWADSDDVLRPENIKKKVDYLEKNPDKGLVACNAQEIDQDTGKQLCELRFEGKAHRDNIFRTLIFGGVPCYPGVFMIRTDILFMKLSNKEIAYDPEVGQNWQLLLPVAYDNACGYIEDVLYDYYVRWNSHSHNQDYKRQIKRTFCQEDILKKILVFCSDDDYEIITREIIRKYCLQRFDLAFRYKEKKDAQSYYSELKSKGLASLKYWIKYISLYSRMLSNILDKLIGD